MRPELTMPTKLDCAWWTCRSDDEPASTATPVVKTAADVDEDDEDAPHQASGSASRFADFSSFVDDDAGDDDEDDGGGLMAAIRSSESKKKAKKDKKKAKRGAADDDGEDASLNGDVATDEIASSKAPVQMTAEELMEEEFGPVKAKPKGKKGKKGKTQGQPGIDDDDEFLNEQIKGLSVQQKQPEVAANPSQDSELATKTVQTTPSTATPAQGDNAAAVNEEGEGESKGVLSKKEKERLKKEKEKVSMQSLSTFESFVVHLHTHWISRLRRKLKLRRRRLHQVALYNQRPAKKKYPQQRNLASQINAKMAKTEKRWKTEAHHLPRTRRKRRRVQQSPRSQQLPLKRHLARRCPLTLQHYKQRWPNRRLSKRKHVDVRRSIGDKSKRRRLVWLRSNVRRRKKRNARRRKKRRRLSS